MKRVGTNIFSIMNISDKVIWIYKVRSFITNVFINFSVLFHMTYCDYW